MKAIIESPVKTYNGQVAGINFAGGKAEDDNVTDAQLAYFKRHGYDVKVVGKTPKTKEA